MRDLQRHRRNASPQLPKTIRSYMALQPASQTAARARTKTQTRQTVAGPITRRLERRIRRSSYDVFSESMIGSVELDNGPISALPLKGHVRRKQRRPLRAKSRHWSAIRSLHQRCRAAKFGRDLGKLLAASLRPTPPIATLRGNEVSMHRNCPKVAGKRSATCCWAHR